MARATPQRSDRVPPAGVAEPGFLAVLAIALPVVLSNGAVPLQGAIDTAIMGNTGDTALLAAVALGAAAIGLLIGTLNFLHASVSGTTAQAVGAARRERAVNTLIRGMALALTLGLAIAALRHPLAALLMHLFEGSARTEAASASYLAIRLIGAPAELGSYVLMGWFSGQGRTRRLLEMQIAASLVNVVATLTLVLGAGLGIEGLAVGTLIGQGTGFVYGLVRAAGTVRWLMPAGWRPDWVRVARREEIVALLRLSRDFFLRTLLLAICFAWVARLGSLQGEAVLAANGVLLEFFLFTAAALDGFAIAAEALVGRAVGARSPRALRAAIRTVLAAAATIALALAAALAVAAPWIVALFTDLEDVRAVAGTYVLWAALLPLPGVAPFTLDGIFVGAADGRAMLRSMAVAAAAFLPLGWAATLVFGNHGLWAAFWALLILRAVALALYLPALEARVARGAEAGSTSAPTASASEA